MVLSMEKACLNVNNIFNEIFAREKNIYDWLDFGMSFSLIGFNQMSWSMNKKHTGKKDEIYDEHILTAVQ